MRPTKIKKSNPARLSKKFYTPALDSSLLTDIFWILTKGSLNARIKLAGFRTSNKFKNHYSNNQVTFYKLESRDN